MQQMSHLLIR